MSTPTRIAAVIAAINRYADQAERELRQEIQGMTDWATCSEFFFVSNKAGETMATGYTEAELLQNLEQLLAEVAQ